MTLLAADAPGDVDVEWDVGGDVDADAAVPGASGLPGVPVHAQHNVAIAAPNRAARRTALACTR
jgi:hypothetical protein